MQSNPNLNNGEVMSIIHENSSGKYTTQNRNTHANSPGAQKYKIMKKGGTSNSGNILNDNKSKLLINDNSGTGANFMMQQRTNNGSGELL